MTLGDGKNGRTSPARSLVYDLYPNYNGIEWRKSFIGTFQRCDGPRGGLLDRRSADDMISVYPGVPDSNLTLAMCLRHL